MIYMSFRPSELARNGQYWHGNHRSQDLFLIFRNCSCSFRREPACGACRNNSHKNAFCMIYMSFRPSELARNGQYWHGNHRSQDLFLIFRNCSCSFRREPACGACRNNSHKNAFCMIYMSFRPSELARNGQYWLVIGGWQGGDGCEHHGTILR